MNFQSKGLNAIVRHGLVLLIACGCGMVQAQVPRQITYQGFLTNPGGAPINSQVQMVFRLYPSPTGGTAIYTETQSVTVENGIYNVLLGSVTPLSLPFDVPYFLGVTAAADAEMTPRQPLTASPYALNAATTSALASTATVVSSQIADHSVTQQKLSPTGGTAGQVLGTNGTDLVWQTGGGGGGGISAVTASPPLASSGGPTPNISVTGTLPVANGGTGQTSLSTNGILFGQGSGPVGSAVGTAGQVLTGTGGAPTWTGSPSLGGNLNVAGSVGVGTTTPQANLEVYDSIAIIQATSVGAGTGGWLYGKSANGNKASPTATTAGNELASFRGSGHDGSSFRATRAFMSFYASENWTSNAEGAEIAFATAASGTTNPVERMRITDDGHVGIGTSTPEGNFEVFAPSTAQITGTAHGSIGLFIGRSAGGTIGAETAVTNGTQLAFFGAQGYTGTGFSGIRAAVMMNASENFTGSANGAEIAFGTTANGTSSRLERMRITNDGKVGIGTATPTKARVEIAGTAGSVAFGQRGVLNDTGALSLSNTGTATPAGSLWAADNVWAAAFIAFSDERIKRIEGRSDATRDLATLAGIEVTDYTYIDTVTKGSGKHKKVIAQQVEKVYPQAVTRSTDTVPDIYRTAKVSGGWVSLATNLKKGERVRLIGKDKEGIHEVLEVAPGRFRTAFAADGDSLFVYGREVKDFRSVDYEAIAMLNVSATQELNRRLEQQLAQIEAQTARIAQLEHVRMAQMARIDALEMQGSEIAALKQQVALMVQLQQQTARASGVVAELAARQ